MENMAIVSCNEIVDLPIGWIKPNPYQPRKYFERSALEDLARSIRQYGVMQPVSVRFLNSSSYELVSGERRLKAAKIAGLYTIPCIIVNVDDKDSAAIALIENIQRENLNFIEEAEGFFNLMNDYGYTQEGLAEILGKSQPTIANKLRILRLDSNVQKKIIENNLTERHARALLKINDVNLQEEILDKVIKFGLNVKRTEELIEDALKKKDENKDISGQNVKRYIRDIRLFTNTIKQAVSLMQESGVETEYEVNKNDEVYEINIKINYK